MDEQEHAIGFRLVIFLYRRVVVMVIVVGSGMIDESVVFLVFYRKLHHNFYCNIPLFSGVIIGITIRMTGLITM